MMEADGDECVGRDKCIDGEGSNLEHRDMNGEREANPWPYLKDFFEFKSANDNNFIRQCKRCMLKETQLSTYKHSASDLRKHVQVRQPRVKLNKVTCNLSWIHAINNFTQSWYANFSVSSQLYSAT